jgi:glycosyltransferase involved in cell wall biosynthesis
MNIVSISQFPKQHIHEAWMNSITNAKNTLVYYIPEYCINSKILNKFIWYNPFLNQLCALLRAINLPRADIYLGDGFKTILPAIFNKGKSKIIVINSDIFLSELPKKNFLVRWIYKWYIRKVDYFICTSKMMVGITSKYSDKPKFVVYPFYHPTKFKGVSCDIESSNICSISTAKLCKRPDIMLKAFRMFRKAYPQSKLIVCDGGTYGGPGVNDFLKKIKKEENTVTPGIDLSGPCDPVPCLKQSGLYINTAQHESFGVNIMEAMLVGIPPVISKFCGAKDLIEKIDKSLICDLDAAQFAARLIELQKNVKKKKELGKKCQDIVAKHTPEYSINEFKTVLRNIAADMGGELDL